MNLLVQLLVAGFVWRSIDFLYATGRAAGFAEPSFLGCQALLVMGIVVLVLAHETGHWVAGMAVGWRFLRFRLGPLAIVKVRDGCRVQFIKWNLGGGVTFAPNSLGGFRKADAIFSAGGPLASLIFALGCGLLAAQAGSAAAFWVWGSLAQWSVLGVFSLIPCGTGLARSDGYWLWALLRGGEQTERRKRYLLANLSHGTATRPRDWPADLMGQVIGSYTSTPDRHDCYLAYIHLLDADQPHAAIPWLAKVMERPAKADPPEYALEAAYCQSVYGHNPDEAGKWLGSAGKDTPPWVRLRAEAAVAWAKGELERAQVLAAEALPRMEAALPCGAIESERARLNYLMELVSSDASSTATA
jgi:hypothetical protein